MFSETKVDIKNYDLEKLYYDYILFYKLIRKDYFNKESEYFLVDEAIQGRSALSKFCSLNCDYSKNMKILLLSDLHLGNKDFEDKELLQNLYDFAYQNGVTSCMILGDIFGENSDGIINEECFARTLDSFREFFPESDTIKTFAIKGNHDEKFDNFQLLDYIKSGIDYVDFRQLQFLKSNFYPLPIQTINVNFSNRGIKDNYIIDKLLHDVYIIQSHLSYQYMRQCMVRDILTFGDDIIIKTMIEKYEKNHNLFVSSLSIIQNTPYEQLIKNLLIRKLCLLNIRDYQDLTISDVLTYDDVTEYENNITLGQLVSYYGKTKIDDKRTVSSLTTEEIINFIHKNMFHSGFIASFSHRLNISIFDREVIINKAEDIVEHEEWMDPSCDLYVSGHLHKGFIYGTCLEKYKNKNVLYLNCPSSSKINIGGVVGYILDIRYLEDKMEELVVKPIMSDFERRLFFGEPVCWKVNEKNQRVLRKYNL